MKRIDAASCRQIEDKWAERMRNQSASPGTEAALHRLIDGLIGGKPNYDEMSPRIVEATRDQLEDLHADLGPLDSVQSIRFLGVGRQGEDVYIVKHERGDTRHWRIALDSKGMIVMGRRGMGDCWACARQSAHNETRQAGVRFHGSAHLCACSYEVGGLRIHLYLRRLDLGERVVVFSAQRGAP
jgi:hypothetical protein